jgi:hypothetical protein
MSLVVRKIEYIKWTQRRILEGEQPSADAITNCMKTNRNRLSVWSIDDEGELEDAVIAIVSVGTHLDTIDVLTIDKSLIEQKNLVLEKSSNPTPYFNFEERHCDVVNLDYASLGYMAEIIIESIRQDRRKRFTEPQLKRIMTIAVETGKVEFDELEPDIKKKISR